MLGSLRLLFQPEVCLPCRLKRVCRHCQPRHTLSPFDQSDLSRLYLSGNPLVTRHACKYPVAFLACTRAPTQTTDYTWQKCQPPGPIRRARGGHYPLFLTPFGPPRCSASIRSRRSPTAANRIEVREWGATLKKWSICEDRLRVSYRGGEE